MTISVLFELVVFDDLLKIRSDYVSKMHKCDLDPVAHAKLLRVAGTTQMAYIDEFTIKVNSLLLISQKKIFIFRNRCAVVDLAAIFLRIWKNF